jgi:nucleoside-triphosphatase
MGKVIFLTGAPGSGKTTAIQKIVSRLSVKPGGFYTQEIREMGVRKGFKIITLDSQESILAHVDIKGAPRIGKYGVDLLAIEDVAVESMHRAMREASLIVVDEIGPMEILSDSFRKAVMQILDSEVDVVGSIVKRKIPFAEAIKAHPNVTVLEIHHRNRHIIVDQVLEFLEA